MGARAVFLVAAVFGAVACKKNVERAETGKVAAPARQAEQGEPRERSQPVNNDHLRGIIKLDSAHGSTCALDDQGRVFCWGRIEHASSEKGVSRPWRIGGLPEVRDIRVGDPFAAVGRDGQLFVWGYGVAPYYEPLPPRAECVEQPEARGCSEQVRYEIDPEFDPELAQKKYPDEVFAHDSREWLEARTPQIRDTRRALFSRLTIKGDFLEGGGIHDEAKGEVTLFGSEPFMVSVKQEVRAMLASWRGDEDWAWCFVYSSGELECPLALVDGEITKVTAKYHRLPSRVRSVGTNGNHGGVIALDDGRVVSWNRDATVHPFVEGIVEVDGGPGLACGIDTGGKVQCWQHPRAVDRPLSAEERAVVQPRAIPGIDDAVQITSSGYHSCVILSDTRVKCWGLNESGECGVGHYAEEVEEPAYVLGPDNMEAGS